VHDLLDRLKAALADRYTIEHELGAGGMATVYLAEDLKLHRKVAIKVLRPELAATLGTDRFLQEIELTANLQHPQILPLHEAGEADGFLYYVMPYIEGESLRERLDREGALPVGDAIKITDDIGAALSYADGRGVVHRDIKPENVMLTGGRAVVADFGIARAVTAAGGERLTGTGLAIGTPAYMSPEQATGLEDVDGRSDVYALGCVVHEMVAGRPPFEATMPQALLAKHAVDAVPALRASDPTIPVFVERAVGRALAKNPADRFQSASAFAEALTTGTVVARVGRRHWRGRVAGAAVVLVAVSGWFLSIMLGEPAIERLAVLPFTNLMNDPDQEWIVQGTFDALITELGQAGVTVISRTSVMQYQDTEKSIREIARELNVDAIIDGSVFLEGDSVGIQVGLVHGRTEAQLWSQSYDGDVRSVMALYRDVTRAIAAEIQLALTPQAEARLASAAPTVDPEALEAYLRGRFHSYQFTPADQDLALQFFESALSIDPNYALAYTGIASLWGNRLVMGIVPPREAGPRWKDAVSKALELDSTLGAAQGALAFATTWVDWDWDAAEAAYERALALSPDNADARIFYGHFLMIVRGRAKEARVQIERALELDPLNSLYHALYGFYLGWIGQNDDAIAQFRTALQTSPNQPLARGGLRGTLRRLGMLEEAFVDHKASLAARGDTEAVEALERGFAIAGYPGAMNLLAETLAARSRTTYVKPIRVAHLYSLAGKVDDALDWLERAYDVRDHDMVYLGVGDYSDSVRNHPRFRELLRRMKLPQ
jgi:serine/threonine-protein kinase